MRNVLRCVGVGALLCLAPIPSSADPILVGGIGFGSRVNRGALVTVSETTGTGVVVSPGAGPAAGLTGVTFDAMGTLYGTTISNPISDPGAGNPSLARFSSATRTLVGSSPITFRGDPLEIHDLAAHPVTGVLYGASVTTTDSGSSIYTIDKTSGIASLIGSTGVLGVTLAFGPDSTLYMTSATFETTGTQTGSFLNTVNPATGALLSTTPIATLPSGNLVHFGGLAVRPDGTIFGAGREATAAQSGDIYTLSRSGAATRVGSTRVGEVGDLAFSPVPEPATIFLLGTGLAGLGAFRRRNRTRNT
jgi:hypothetical protein